MQIKLKQPHFQGTRTHAKGDTLDLRKEQAIKLIEQGKAEPVREQPVEQATQKPKTEKAKK